MKIYKDGEYIGYVKFLKNKNHYGIYFSEDNTYSDILIGVNSLDDYLKDMGLKTENEVFTDGN